MIQHWAFTCLALSAYFLNTTNRLKLASLWVFANFFIGGVINAGLPDDFVHVRVYLLIDLLTGAAIVYIRGPWLVAALLVFAAVIGEMTIQYPGGFFDINYEYFYFPVNFLILLSLIFPPLLQVLSAYWRRD